MKKRNVLMLACVGALGCGPMLAQTDVTTTGGTTRTIPVFTGASAIGNSIISQSGTTATVSDTVNAVTGYQIGGQNAVSESTGFQNLAIGPDALPSPTGRDNTATGWSTLGRITSGQYNTGHGFSPLYFNTTGSNNSGFGFEAMFMNSTGSENTAIGSESLYVATGSSNTALGYFAGYQLGSGSNNIDIGASVVGTTSDSGVIRIGGTSNTTTYIAGIYGVTTGTAGVEVYVDASGQLGTKSSSIRYKEDVQDMDHASDGLFRLRPVTFRYKKPYADGSTPVDYGLIAEEVAEVYPDMVSKNASGQIETVQYSKLAPMLLNEVQKQHQLLEQQAETIRLLEKRLAALESPSQAAK
jgi:hypothetical protein